MSAIQIERKTWNGVAIPPDMVSGWINEDTETFKSELNVWKSEATAVHVCGDTLVLVEGEWRAPGVVNVSGYICTVTESFDVVNG